MSTAHHYLGIDLGTSEIKALLMGVNGEVLAVAHAPLECMQPQLGWSEQSPASWWRALVLVCKQLQLEAPEHFAKVWAIGLSGHMHGATLLDSDNAVLRPCILWNDGRSAAQCTKLAQLCPDLQRITGNLAMPGFTAPKVMWVAEHEPGIFQRIAKVLLPKDYLRFLLTDKFVSEMSDAAGTLWLDVEKRAWSATVLTATGLDCSHMPALIEGSGVSGFLTAGAAAQLGLKVGIALAGGAGDNAASAIGIGAVSPGDSFLSLGTSGVLFSVTDKHRPNTANAVHAFCHALPQSWHQMAVMLSAASCLRWVTQLTGFASEADLMDSVALLTQEERAHAPIFLPYLSGERTPHNNPDATGVFVGLRFGHAASHVAYAVVEGVSFGLLDGLNALRSAGSHIEQTQLVGGGSKSEFWAQLLADVLEVDIHIGKDSNVGAALGAARLAQLCIEGTAPATLAKVCTKPAIERAFRPRAEQQAILSKRYAQFGAAYGAMQPIFYAAAH